MTSPPRASASACGARGPATSSSAVTRDDVSRRRLPVPHRARDHRRSRAGAGAAGHVRRRARLGAVRPDRVRPRAVERRCGRPGARTGWSRPATAPSTRCASRRAIASGRATSRPTRRRTTRVSGSRSPWTRPAASSARDALVAAKAAGPRKRLRCLVLDDPRSVCLGNEPVRVGGDGRRPRDDRRLRVRRGALDRLRLPAAGSGRDRDAWRGGGLRPSGSGSRSRGSRCTTRPTRGSAHERRDAPRSGQTGRPRSAAGRMPSCAAGSTSPRRPATRPTRSRAPTSGATCRSTTKPDRTFVTQADTAIETPHPRAPAGRLPGSRPGRRGVRHGGGRGVGPLVHRPDRRHPQLHARRARSSRRCSPWSATASSQAAVISAPGPRRALVGAPGRRGLGHGAAGATAPRRVARVAASRAGGRPGPVRLRP